ncbi:molybdate ABC transporter substrate-binding protein [Oscillatoriales cyanobacterium USR001]|nr:molybdate ABC transporter substrate-binding protein [Oscillatoriales cyanobacterium USR001]
MGSCSSPPSQVINLNFGSAGISRNAIQELEDIYQQEYPYIVINSIFAGSAVIQKAIERGEPFDGVLFGEIRALNELQAKGLILPKSRKEFLSTEIVLIARADSSLQLANFQELADNRIKKVAIGNENLAIGRYTKTLLNRMGINQVVASKAILAKGDVREVLNAVEQGEAEVGITFLSEAKSSAKVKVLATASKDFYDPLIISVAAIKSSKHSQEIQAYLNFLSSDRAIAVFEKFGLVPLHS